MMFDGVVGSYFPRNTIYYEYGTGVSTNGKTICTERLKREWDTANGLMMAEKDMDPFQMKVIEIWKQYESGRAWKGYS